ncbi:MAG: alpha/beta fold hydrolase [Bacilli bacterium]
MNSGLAFVLGIVSALVFVFLIFLFILLSFCAHLVAYPHLFSLRETWVVEKGKNLIYDYPSEQKEAVTIVSFDGYHLHGTYVPFPGGSKKYVIITHGNSYTRFGSLKYLDLFRKEGFNVLLYDDRGHGENAKAVCTMGLKESKDLLAIIDYLHHRFGDDIILGLHGESMGAAISLLVLADHPSLSFVVADCPYADLEGVLKHQLKIHYHLPGFLVPLAGVVCFLLYHYNFNQVKPFKALRNNQVPLCFMHGEGDTFIPPEHSLRLSEANHGYSEVHLFPRSEHAQSFPEHEKDYRAIVHAFLEKTRNL